MGRSESSRPLRVILQCRHRFFREGLASLLADHHAVDVVATVVTPAELLGACDEHEVDAILVAVDEGDDDTLTTAGAIGERLPGLRCVALCNDTRRARAASDAGMRPVMTTVEGAEGVVRALTSDAPVREVFARRASGANVLTQRETEVLGLIGEGCTTWEISEHLGISRKTVENHKQRIFLKLDVQNQAHAVAVAVRRGLIDVEVSSTAGVVG